MKFADLMPWKSREVTPQGQQDQVASFRREMDRLFENFFTDPFSLEGRSGPFVPAIDVSENDAAIEVKVELPGIDQKDVELLLDDGALMIRGEKKSESEREEGELRIKESSCGRFERVVPLPVEVDREKVEATTRKGVLLVTLPKTEKARTSRRKIAVREESV